MDIKRILKHTQMWPPEGIRKSGRHTRLWMEGLNKEMNEENIEET